MKKTCEREMRVCLPCWDARDKDLLLHNCEMVIPDPLVACDCICPKKINIDSNQGA